MSITITGRTLRRLALFLVAVAAIALLAYLAIQLVSDKVPASLQDNPNHAVTLSSGELYFGTLQPASSGFYELRNAHVVRERPGEGRNAEPTREVIPISAQAHQPNDALFIREDQLVAVQTLQRDSTIAKAMRSDD